MSVRQTIKRHYKIISCLKKRPMSFEELVDEMQLEEALGSEGMVTSQRTFQRDIYDIEIIYGIEIISDRSQNKYTITENSESQHSERLRENFDLLNAIRMAETLPQNFIFEERRALGTQHMSGLLHALQNKLRVTFNYHKYYDDSESTREVKPLALKESRNRWYLIAEDSDGTVKNFGLDRISRLRISDHKFLPPRNYNIEEEFRHCFGIISGTQQEPVKVVLSFTPQEGRYIKSLPLHHSQQLLLENEEEIRMSLFLQLTHDFRMELLSFGNQVQVLEPESLRQDLREQLEETLKNYS